MVVASALRVHYNWPPIDWQSIANLAAKRRSKGVRSGFDTESGDTEATTATRALWFLAAMAASQVTGIVSTMRCSTEVRPSSLPKIASFSGVRADALPDCMLGALHCARRERVDAQSRLATSPAH